MTATVTTKRARPWTRAWRWLFGDVNGVPAEMAACEFECRELDCDHDRWARCERRRDWAEQLREQEDGTENAAGTIGSTEALQVLIFALFSATFIL